MHFSVDIQEALCQNLEGALPYYSAYFLHHTITIRQFSQPLVQIHEAKRFFFYSSKKLVIQLLCLEVQEIHDQDDSYEISYYYTRMQDIRVLHEALCSYIFNHQTVNNQDYNQMKTKCAKASQCRTKGFKSIWFHSSMKITQIKA